MLFQSCLFLGGGRGEALHFQHRTTTSAHSMEVSLVQIQVHPHFCTQGEAQAVFQQTVKRPGETESLSCPWLNSFLCRKQRAELIGGSRSNYQQGLGSVDAWVNSDCSFHQIPNRNNNTGIVLHFSLRGFGDGAGRWEAGGKLTVGPCSGGASPDPAAAGSGFWHRRCQLHGEKPSLSYHLLIKPSVRGQKRR